MPYAYFTNWYYSIVFLLNNQKHGSTGQQYNLLLLSVDIHLYLFVFSISIVFISNETSVLLFYSCLCIYSIEH